jgi:hypothetical protein
MCGWLASEVINLCLYVVGVSVVEREGDREMIERDVTER